MNRLAVLVGAIVLILVTATGTSLLLQTRQSDEAPHALGLAESMQKMQYYTHKLGLSVTGENAGLSDFYVHELEELAEEIMEDIPEYDGHRIGSLVETLLLPEIERLEDLLPAANWPAISEQFDGLIGTCNQCHAMTDHGYIVIERRTEVNPYLQAFRPR